MTMTPNYTRTASHDLLQGLVDLGIGHGTLDGGGGHHAVDRMVVHDEQFDRAVVNQFQGRHRLGWRRGHGQRNLDAELRAHPDLAVHADGAAMAVDQGAGDAQAQTVAAQGVARCGLAIGLGELDEGVKDFVLGLDGDATPTVLDAHHQIALAGAGALVVNLHGHMAMVSELEGIAQQVDENLGQAVLVTAHPFGQAGTEHQLVIQAQVAGTRFENAVGFVQHHMQVKYLWIEHHTAILDL